MRLRGRSAAAPGSYDHFDQDFRFFASVGADYVKVDYCGEPNTTNKCCFTVLDTDQEINSAIESTRRAATAINAIKTDADPNKRRSIVMNISAPAYANWNNNTYNTPLFQRMLNSIVPAGHAYRIGGDVGGVSWAGAVSLVDMVEQLRPYGKQGHFLDADRLYFDDTTLTTDNKLGGYVMWAMQNSHMVAMIRNSNASGAISAAQAALMNKPAIIAVGQDALATPHEAGRPGHRLRRVRQAVEQRRLRGRDHEPFGHRAGHRDDERVGGRNGRQGLHALDDRRTRHHLRRRERQLQRHRRRREQRSCTA